MKKGYGISFELYGIDDEKYRLVVKNGKNSDGTTWSYDKVHRYGKEIITFLKYRMKTMLPNGHRHLPMHWPKRIFSKISKRRPKRRHSSWTLSTNSLKRLRRI